jgi:hypothetical protein
MVKFMDPVHGAVDRWRAGSTVDRAGSVLPAQGASGAAGLRSSPAEAGEGKGDEAVSMRGSPEHGRW